MKGFVATTGNGQPRPTFPDRSDTTGRILNLRYENVPSSHSIFIHPLTRSNPTLLRFQGYSKQVRLVYPLIKGTVEHIAILIVS